MSARIDRVIVTGAGSGIGEDVARRVVGLGARVVLNGRDKAKLERVAASLGATDRVAIVDGSIADPATARRLAEAALERFGGADVLVNNAGVFRPKPFLETTPADLDDHLSINLKGNYYVTQAVVPLMIGAGGGAIVNIGTVLVNQGMTGLPVSAAMASKGGVHALTVSLAAELARYRIRVNTVAAGIIRTPLHSGDPEEMAAIHPLGRIGEVSDTTDAVLFLARAPFVTGTCLDVDGGYAHGR